MSQPIITLFIFALQIPAVILTTTIHEFVRAAVSTILGDKKPKNEGRLTINPLNHFEPVGFILMWATGFGWGKPVDTNPMFYKNRKRDSIIVALAPSVANIIIAVIASFLYKVTNGNSQSLVGTLIPMFFIVLKRFNICMFVYNIIPITPMDCVKVLSCVMPANTYFKYIQYEKIIQMAFLLFLFMGYVSRIVEPIIQMFMILI